MPLRVFSQALGLPDPVIRVSEPAWLFAETVNLQGITLMLVYRSVELRDTDAMYDGVTALLNRSTPELIYNYRMPDPGVFFGEGEIIIYLLHTTEKPSEPTDPAAQTVVDMLRNWGTPVPNQQVEAEINRRLLERAGSLPCKQIH